MTGSPQPPDSDSAPPTGNIRQSVATQREPSSNRSTLIMGGLSLLAAIALVVSGFVLNARSTAVPDDGYGTATVATAHVTHDGAIDVGETNARVHVEIFQDPLCESCGEFERQYAQQIARATDDGELAVRYRIVDFYNPNSASGDYGTRAYAALMAAADVSGDQPGEWLTYYATIFNEDNKPEDHGDTDLSNEQLAQLAQSVGVTISADDIAQRTSQAAADAEQAIADLRQAWGERAAIADTPTVVYNGDIISTNSATWLTTLLNPED